MKPIIAIIGRPNVGKSTLFNRITKKKNAIVDDFPGVTRDRIYCDALWNDTAFTLIDTGGFSDEDNLDFITQTRYQAEIAIEEADIIILVFDGKSGISPFDKDLVDRCRKVDKNIIYAVNKIDGYEQEYKLYDFANFGLDSLFPISAEHGYGINSLLDNITNILNNLKISETEDIHENTIKISIVGRPNSGKSSLINKISGYERAMVSEIPGTTRDSIDTLVTVSDQNYLLIDTAGIRRKGKVHEKIEKFSVIKALKSLERCDIALIVIDSDKGISQQDIRIAGYAYEKKCAIIFLLNKWDLIEKEPDITKKYIDDLYYQAKFLKYAPVITISALTGLRVNKIFKQVNEIFKQYNTRINTGQINKIIEKAVFKNEPSMHKGRRIKIYYATQASTKPPTFVCFVNYPDAVHFSYQRYLVNYIRNETNLTKTPIRLYFRPRNKGKEKK